MATSEPDASRAPAAKRRLALSWLHGGTVSRNTVALAAPMPAAQPGRLLASRPVFDATFDSMERSVVHGSTFGGGDLAAAAGLAALTVLDHEQLATRAQGLGDLLLFAALNKDIPLLEASVMVIASVYMLANLGTELLFGVLNPRIRYA